jgi:hypothetical protein
MLGRWRLARKVGGRGCEEHGRMLRDDPDGMSRVPDRREGGIGQDLLIRSPRSTPVLMLYNCILVTLALVSGSHRVENILSLYQAVPSSRPCLHVSVYPPSPPLALTSIRQARAERSRTTSS